MKICVMRHGQTDWNVQKKIQGQKILLVTHRGTARAIQYYFTVIFGTFQKRRNPLIRL
jgi:broad specificity phosphatase PhoE